MRIVTLALLVLFIIPAWASEPGQPLDCEDWVFLAPGLYCLPILPFPCSSDFCNPAEPDTPGIARVEDNEGRQIMVRQKEVPVTATCVSAMCDSVSGCTRVEIVALDTLGQEHVLAYLEDRCCCVGPVRVSEQISLPNLPRSVDGAGYSSFNPTEGRLTVPLHLGAWTGYEAGEWVAGIHGFATTLEVAQTYTPTISTIGFTVPYMPEGFQYADYFDTYWGDLATVGDWGQAQPLQCGYPPTAPSVGDYLTVEDTLATPTPGQGYYYVTAVNYQGQRRYGRQSNGGVLTGRDPAVLPICE